MKKTFLYFMAIASALTIGLSSCSKDDTPAKDVEKEYTGEELVVTNAGETIPNGRVKIEAIDNTKAKIILTNIVNGNPSFEVEAQVIQTKAEYAFTGTKNIPGMDVAVKGVIVNGKTTVDVAIKAEKTDILNSWTFNVDAVKEEVDFIIFDLQNKSGKAMFGGQEITITEYNNNVTQWIQLIGYMALEKMSLTFNENGYVGVSAHIGMAPEGQQDISMPKLARYYYNPSANLLVFDAPLNDLLGKSSEVGQTLQVPFNCKIEKGILTATIKPEFLAQFLPMIPTGDTLKELLQLLKPLMPADFVGFFPIIEQVIIGIVDGITDPDMTSLTFGAKLMPVPPAPAE